MPFVKRPDERECIIGIRRDACKHTEPFKDFNQPAMRECATNPAHCSVERTIPVSEGMVDVDRGKVAIRLLAGH